MTHFVTQTGAVESLRPLTILGRNVDGSVVFTLGNNPEPLELDESELTELLKALHDDYLALYPFEPCEACDDGRDAVATIDGRHLCEEHVMGYGYAEEGS